MKKSTVVFIILLLLIADQAFKFYIKTQYTIGEEHKVIGNWFKLHFVENEGMAWGWKLGNSGSWGKMALTIFRMIAVIAGVFILGNIIRKKYHKGFIICVSLIFAGALGNLIDSMFYGLIFDTSCNSDGLTKCNEVAKAFTGKGYAGFLHGKVVDMLYFPIFNGHFPKWVPWMGGKEFEFFSPVFNIADACISIGLITILIFQNRLLKQQTEENKHQVIETKTLVTDNEQIS